MTIDDAKRLRVLLNEFEQVEYLGDRIRKLHQQGEHEKIANIAMELDSELIRQRKERITLFTPND